VQKDQPYPVWPKGKRFFWGKESDGKKEKEKETPRRGPRLSTIKKKMTENYQTATSNPGRGKQGLLAGESKNATVLIARKGRNIVSRPLQGVRIGMPKRCKKEKRGKPSINTRFLVWQPSESQKKHVGRGSHQKKRAKTINKITKK